MDKYPEYPDQYSEVETPDGVWKTIAIRGISSATPRKQHPATDTQPDEGLPDSE